MLPALALLYEVPYCLRKLHEIFLIWKTGLERDNGSAQTHLKHSSIEKNEAEFLGEHRTENPLSDRYEPP